jgi:hypothetical protein
MDPIPADSSASEPASHDPGGVVDAPVDPEPNDEPEPEQPTDDGCAGCGSTAPPAVTADGRRIPARSIATRGRGMPDTGCLG